MITKPDPTDAGNKNKLIHKNDRWIAAIQDFKIPPNDSFLQQIRRDMDQAGADPFPIIDRLWETHKEFFHNPDPPPYRFPLSVFWSVLLVWEAGMTDEQWLAAVVQYFTERSGA
jgi:hypothetical protein